MMVVVASILRVVLVDGQTAVSKKQHILCHFFVAYPLAPRSVCLGARACYYSTVK